MYDTKIILHNLIYFLCTIKIEKSNKGSLPWQTSLTGAGAAEKFWVVLWLSAEAVASISPEE